MDREKHMFVIHRQVNLSSAHPKHYIAFDIVDMVYVCMHNQMMTIIYHVGC